MAYVTHISGFEVKDIHMTDIVNGKENLEDINMIVFFLVVQILMY